MNDILEYLKDFLCQIVSLRTGNHVFDVFSCTSSLGQFSPHLFIKKKRRGNIDDNNDHNAILFEKDIDIMIGYSNQFCCLHKIGRMQN